jgi:hypothetical protein
MVVLFSFGLPFLAAYLLEYFIHPFYVLAGIIDKKFQLRNNAHLVFNPGAQLIPDFVGMQLNCLQCQLRIGVIKKA